MAFKVVRTFGLPANDYEKEVLDRVGATMEVIPPPTSPRTEEELISMTRDADAVICVYEPFTRSVIEGMEKCRVLSSFAVGYQHIDVEAATDCGVCVINNPKYCLDEVSDHALALLLNLGRKLPGLDKAIRAGKTGFVDMAEARGRVFRLRGRTLGLVGFGNIPRTLVPKAKSFGFKIIAYDPYVSDGIIKDRGVEPVDFDRLLEESDYISVHAAVNRENVGMFGLEQFKKMKPTAFFVNTARGALVDSNALNTALSEGLIAGAGLDVTEPEPPNPDDPLLKQENVIFTGHSAYFSETSVAEQPIGLIEDIARVVTGEWPQALLNPQVKEKFTQRWGRP